MPPERKRIGPYEVLRKLGAGGMGTVYLALDEEGRTVAVKAIHPHVAEDVVGLRRLAREVEATMRVASPYVAELVDADLEGNPAYIVTRYVQGRSLQEIVDHRGPLAGEALGSLGQGLATALDAIHGVDVVHRDLSPRNVMLADGVPVVIDFGLAQAFDATRITQNLIGTPGFVAPEVIMGDRAGPQADIFSWGAVMVFAATGRRCFGGATLMEIMHRTLAQDPDMSGVPRDLLPLLWRCLRKGPMERPQANVLIAGFRTLSPGSAASPPAPQREVPQREVPQREALQREALQREALQREAPQREVPQREVPQPVASRREAPQREVPQRETSASRVTALWAAAGQAREKGEDTLAEELYGQVRQIAVRTGDRASEMFATHQLGSAAESRGDYQAARAHYLQVRQIAGALGSATIEALAFRGLARLASVVGDDAEARAFADQANRVVTEKHKQGYQEHPEGPEDEPLLRLWSPW